MMTNRRRFAIAIAALTLFAFSCGSDSPAEPVPAQGEASQEPQPAQEESVSSADSVRRDGPVKFGFLAGLSGDYAEWGPPSLDGAEAAIGVINAAGGILGAEVELVVQDNMSTAEGAVTGYNRIREEIDALGGVESDGAVALLNTVAEDEMPTMCPACGTTVLDSEGGNFIWRITASDTTYGVMSAQLARDLGYTRVAMLVQQTEGTESPAEVFRDVWENKIGGEITADVRFQPGQDSYQAQVAQAFSGDPDAVYIGAGPQAGIPIIREYIARGHTATILVSPDLQVPDIAETAAELPTGRILAAQVTDDFESPAYAAFAAAHQEYASKPPPTGFYETNQFDQYIVLALAMTAAGTTDGPAVAAQIYNIVNAPGIKVYTYADGVAALERGEQIDYDGPSGSLELHTVTGNLVSPKVAVNHIVNGSYTERQVIELDPALSLSPVQAPQEESVSPADSVRLEGPVKFGFLAGLSGDYAEWGPPSLDGAEAAIGVINASGGIWGAEVELVVQDNLSTPEGAVTGYNRIREEIDALGGVESDGAVALLGTVAEDEMPTMCPACGTTVLDTEGGNYIWRITASDTTYGIISAQLARDAGYTRVNMLVQQTEGTESPAEVFKDVWENKIGGQIGEDVRFNPGLDSYQAQVEQAFSGNPDAVYIGAGPQAGIPILREYIARGHTAAILVSPDLQVPDIAETAAELPTGRVLAAQVTDDFDSPAYAAFADAHQEYASKPPPTGFYETNQFDQYIVLALAMTAAESTDGPDVAAQIYNIVNAPGTKVYTYADGVAALERGEQIDYDGPSGSLELHTVTGNLVSPKVAVNHIVNGSYTEREVIELDPSLGR